MSDQIFISYSKKDSNFALKLADDLSAAGHKVWIDRSLRVGQDWVETIETNLEQAKEIIVVLSANSMASKWVQHEGSIAYGLKKPMYPVLIEALPDDEMPLWAAKFQYHSFLDVEYEQAFKALNDVLTPPNPIQELLNQGVYAYRETGDLIGESILAVIEEAGDNLTISDEAKALIEKSTSRMIRTRRLWQGGIGLAIVLIAVAIFAIITMISAINTRNRAVIARSGAETKQAEVLATATQVSQEMSVAVTQMNLAITQQAQAEAQAASAQAEAEEYNRQSQIKALYLRASALASQSRQVYTSDPQRSLLLAVEAVNITKSEGQPRALVAEQVLREALDEFDEKIISGREDWVTAVAFSPDGRYLATGGNDTIAHIWDLQTENPESGPIILEGYNGAIKKLVFSSDNRYLVIAGDATSALLWDLEEVLDPDMHSGDAVPTPYILSGHEGKILDLAFSPNDRFLVTGSWDSTIRIWDITSVIEGDSQDPSSSVQPTLLQSHRRGINTLAFSPDGSLLATGGWSNTVYLWDVSVLLDTGLSSLETIDEPILLQGHRGGVNDLAFTPDGKFLSSGGWDNTIRIWDITAILAAPDVDAESAILKGHQGEVNALTFSPDGKFLASGSQDSTARIWELSKVFNTDSQELTATIQTFLLRGHEGSINALAFSPDGDFLVTGGYDTSVRIWDLSAEDPTSQPIILQGHEDWITSLAFSPEGRFLATGSRDTTARSWDLNVENLVELACQQSQRNLTLDEWEQYFSNESYRKTCQQWPISPDLLERAQGFAMKGDQESAIALFELVLQLDPSQDFDPQAEAIVYAAKGLVSQGDELAQDGDIEGALAKFQEALDLDPSLDLDPLSEAQKYVVQKLIQEGDAFAKDMDVESAVAKYQEALAYDATLDLDPEAKAAQLAAPVFIEYGIELAQQGQIDEALAAYTQAQLLEPEVSISEESWYALCWYGGLWGSALEVIAACDLAVDLGPENGRFREGRGLVRALTEDLTGAIDDLEFFVAWAKIEEWPEEYISQREMWITELIEGNIPFNESLLEQLRNE